MLSVEAERAITAAQNPRRESAQRYRTWFGAHDNAGYENFALNFVRIKTASYTETITIEQPSQHLASDRRQVSPVFRSSL